MAVGQKLLLCASRWGQYLRVHWQFLSKLHCLGSFYNHGFVAIGRDHVVLETQLIYRQVVLPSVVLKGSCRKTRTLLPRLASSRLL